VYSEHFGFTKEPFSISPDPGFIWLSEKLAAAFETLKAGILNPDGSVLLTGDIGTGKTALVKRLVQMDGVAAVFVTVSDPRLTGLDLCRALAVELGMNRRFERREDFYASLKPLLLGRFSGFNKVLVVIDEAQRLNPEAVREAVALSSLESAGRKPLKVLFVGQLELNQVLKQTEALGVSVNIAARCDLQPYTQEETQRYVAHRLKVAGRGTPLFTDDAVREVQALSKGVPRLINIVCDHALLYGYGAGLSGIDGRVVKECSRDLTVALDLDPEPALAGPVLSSEEAVPSPDPTAAVAPVRGWRPLLYIAAAVAAAGLVFFVLTR
jgi:type II secretory pathway predicted ATPase ExeA